VAVITIVALILGRVAYPKSIRRLDVAASRG
jgi:hypothetical protein